MDDTVANTARQIRQRIIWVILRAAMGVVFLTVLAVIIITGIALANSLDFPPFNQLPILNRLEGYYMGRGSWDGVQSLLQQDNSFIGSEVTLLDADGRIVLERGISDSPNVGIQHQPAAHEIMVNLKVNDEIVGMLVFNRQNAPSRLGAVTTILGPVSMVAVFVALLAIVVVALLSRRIVTPLAEVIAAARAVSAGKLGTRVQTQGPQDLHLLMDSFNQMAENLDRNDRERRDMLADIAHELRTPISGMRGRLEGMLDGVYPADAQHISLALKSNYLLERLVEDLRLLTLVEARQLHFEPKETDLATLAVHVIEIFSAEAQEKNITLAFEPVARDFRVLVDSQRTEQVIGNLVGNALNYIPAGGKVWITLEETADRVSLAVNDNGPGIPPADLPYIFDRFWRRDKSRSRNTGGSGLGLAISKQMIEAQGGEISASNQPTGGLRIVLSFLNCKASS